VSAFDIQVAKIKTMVIGKTVTLIASPLNNNRIKLKVQLQ
jgi:hypothetical protein